MRNWIGKRYWLVGASEGLGRALAHKISAAGAEVIVSARSRERLDSLVAELPGKAHAVTVDISDSASCAAAAEEVGPIDGVIFLAGLYWPVSALKWQAEEVEKMCDVNFTGAARIIGVTLPGMLAQGQGHIALTGSLAGFRGLPGAIGYSASKAGLMGLAESMYADLRRSPVTVQILNPGFIKTRLTDKNDFDMPFLMEAEEAAAEMFDHLGTDQFKKSFPWLFSLVFRLGQFLPDWLYYRLIARG